MRITTKQIFQQGLGNLQRVQAEMATLQSKVGSGKRVRTPGDDPVAAAAAVQIGERLRGLEQFERNAGQAASRLTQIDGLLGSGSVVLQRVRELLLQGRSESLADADREAIALDLRENLNVLLNIANTRNPSGEFVFAGSRVDTRPFTRDATGAVVYNGDQTTRRIQISETRAIEEGFHGDAVFNSIRAGNGVFATSMNVANTGTAQITDNTVVDPSAFVAHDFRIRFTGPATYDVIDDTLGANVLTAQTYTAGQGITFAGMSVTVIGTPATGDEFNVAPSPNGSIFATIESLAQTLERGFNSDADRARFGFELDRALEDTDQAVEQFAETRAAAGARLRTIDNQRTLNTDAELNMRSLRSELEDVDLTAAISELAIQSATLEAAQAAFVRVQRLSLFNLL